MPCAQLPAGTESISLYLCTRWNNEQDSESSASLDLPWAVVEFRQAKHEQRKEVISKANCYEGNETTADGASWGRRGYFTWRGWQGLMGAECPLDVLLRDFKKNSQCKSQESRADGLGLRSLVA